MLEAFRSVILLLALASAASAQTQASRAAPPDTPAGAVLRAWLDAFNSGDSARIVGFHRQWQPDADGVGQVSLRRDAGGFDLVSIERSDARRVEFIVKEKRSATRAYGIIALSSSEPARLASFPLRALGDDAGASAIRIDAATRARVVSGAIARLAENYVFPDVARRMGDTLRARLARGAYDGETNGIGFAMRLHDELREISRDKHLRVSYRVDAGPPRPERDRPPEPNGVDPECGFAKPARLAGNVGYLRFDFFASPDRCGATASAAMNALADAPALIVDLRQNGGGSPAMVAYVSSYLFDGRTHLNDLWTRRTNHTEAFWTRDVPGARFGGAKPVYVLTSSRTFSGAEEFTYNLKSLGRATIVGETTGGGAHPVRGERIDDRFMIGVPFARAINPITRTNWEGTGVAPDVKVPAADALETALRLIRETPRP